ncbi:MAG: RuBisCO large subunit C-terminal-like domain-containing protein [Anaerolineales bacterium]|nr:RuBisCO large subunit C-terminal-like domain-containing protein [Anaerolineales bacterium]
MLSPTELRIREERFSVIYSLSGDRDEAYRKAEDICIEQTIEFPADLVPDDDIRRHIFGRIESFEQTPLGYQAEISYNVEIVSGEITQLLTVIFGNISLKPGIRAERINFSPHLLKDFQGPRFGIQGLRDRLQVFDRSLLCTAIKPMGLSNKELARLAYQFAKGGIDIIKDDHGICNQSFSPFQDRVLRCVEAIQKANQETGGHAIYAPSVTAPDTHLRARGDFAKQAGAGAILIAPGIVGFDRMQALANDPSFGLPILYHPTFVGSFVTNPIAGMSHYLLFGQLARLSGADIVIFPNYGGRFSFSEQDCHQILLGATDPLGEIKSIFPAPAGGMNLNAIAQMLEFYGKDVVLLIGGDLHRHGNNLIESSKLFLHKVQYLS